MTADRLPSALSSRPVLRAALRFAAIGAVTWAALLGASAMARSAPGDWHTPAFALPLHLATVIPAVPLGLWILLRTKGTAEHRLLGRIWGIMMLVTAIDSLLIRDLSGTLNPIHLFSVITLVSIPVGVWRIRRGDLAGHRRAMTGPYIGLIVAGLFALAPGRMLGTLLFG